VIDNEKCKIALVPMDQTIAEMKRQKKIISTAEEKFRMKPAKLQKAKIKEINKYILFGAAFELRTMA